MEQNIETKKCPHCQSEINVKATKCPHCQSSLSFFRKPIGCGTVILVVIIIIIFSVFFTGSGSNQSSPSSSINNTIVQTPKSPSAPLRVPASVSQKQVSPFSSFSGDGNYIVGTDIQPGTYRTRVPSGNCYYARLSGFGGSNGDILANTNTDGPAVITIAPTDKGFQTSSCGTWTKDLSQITSSKTSFTDGTFIINTDILPGTYRSSGGDNCYYARLSGFGGSNSSIIANENANSSAIVTIASTDVGFQSSNCGMWSRI
jgi:hypothetical protein